MVLLVMKREMGKGDDEKGVREEEESKESH